MVCDGKLFHPRAAVTGMCGHREMTDGSMAPFALRLTSLAVIPSVTWGRAKMQKTVTPSLVDTETDGHAMMITVALRCGESVVKLTIYCGVSISHVPCLPCHLDLIDTISCSNRCMLTLCCLIGHLIVIGRRPTMRDTGTGN